jgi:hypothetical protein
VYNKVADSGDVVIQKQGSSIVDTHEPAIAILLSPFWFLYGILDISYKNRIYPVERYQEVRRLVSPGLHHISSHCGMLRNEGHTPIGIDARQRRCEHCEGHHHDAGDGGEM